MFKLPGLLIVMEMRQDQQFDPVAGVLGQNRGRTQ